MSFKGYIDYYLRRWKRYNSYQDKKKLFIVLITICFLLLWRSPNFFRFAKQRTDYFLSSNRRCVEQSINEAMYGKNIFDFSIKRGYDYDINNDKNYLPYVGNGHIGIAILNNEDESFYIKNTRSLDYKFMYSPLINIDLSESDFERATTLQFDNGVANRFICLTLRSTKQNVIIKETFYAHRSNSSLFVQKIKIINSSIEPLALHFKRKGWDDKLNVSHEEFFLKSNQYYLYSGFDLKRDSSKYIVFVLLSPFTPDFVEVRPKSSVEISFFTFLDYEEVEDISKIPASLNKLKNFLKEFARKIHFPTTKKNLYLTHKSVWNNLWKSGISLSYSKAKGSINGDLINATMYYILSQKSTFSDKKNDLNQENSLIDKPASCYSGYSTLQANSLWSKWDSIETINNVVNIWLLTLDKQGCHNLIASGIEGTLQSLILSMVPLQFTQHDIGFNTHPKNLHRDYFIRQLRYSKGIYINIKVKINEDNRASISVAINRKDDYTKEMYACDAGCLDAPVKLNTRYSNFPIKLTQPLTPILYVTSDKQHIQELKHTIHVKEISLAPAHEDHVIAMHKHGHEIGTFTALFWLTIVFLIVLFHVFLARIVYNEYFLNTSSGSHYDNVKTFVE